MSAALILKQGNHYEMQSMRANMQVPVAADADQAAAATPAAPAPVWGIGARAELVDSLGLPADKNWHVKATIEDLKHLGSVKEIWDEKDPMKMVREAAKKGLIMTYKTAKHLIVVTPRKERVRIRFSIFCCCLFSISPTFL